MTNVIHLATSQTQRPVHACGTCRHFKTKVDYKSLMCMALGEYASIARNHYCHGDMWEPIPPAVPLLTRLKRWLVG